jgi:hypothetical protein
VKARALLAAAALCMAPPSLAQPASDEEVVVRAPAARDERQVRQFVSELTTPDPGRSLMPRWERPLCLSIQGMRAADARKMRERISEVATDVGVSVTPPGCRVNVLIQYTRDADAAARRLASRSDLVAAHGESGNSRGEDALRDFVESPQIVRWWHVTSSYADGIEFGRGREAGANNVARVRNVSRIRGNVQERMLRILIVIDANRAAQAPPDALSDYVAMAVLAELNPDAEVAGVPSILNLFSDANGPRPDALTSWDLAYLHGLYRSAEDSRDSRQQEHQIARSMMGD